MKGRKKRFTRLSGSDTNRQETGRRKKYSALLTEDGPKKQKKNDLQNYKLFFAIFPRVSTEKQAEQGSSLEVQTDTMEEAVTRFCGKIVKRYGGVEHATVDYEHKELEQLINDSYLPFDERGWNAVIFYDHSRWSRDNNKASDYIEKLKSNEIRFFTVSQEWVLTNAEHRLVLGINQVTNEYQSMIGTDKSLKSRIARAREGKFTAGQPPFGRKRDKDGKLTIIKSKKKLIELAAKLYLKENKGFIKIANRLGMHPSVLQRALLHNPGDNYMQNFKCKRLGINESIPTKIPPLLNKNIIKQIQDEAAKRRVYHPGIVKTERLLSGYIFCHDCGNRLSVQELKSKNKTYIYYRHPGKTRAEVESKISELEAKGKIKVEGNRRYYQDTPLEECDKRMFTGRCFNHVKGEFIEDLVMQSLREMLKDSKKFKEALLRPHPSEDENKFLKEELPIIHDSIEKIKKKERRLLKGLEEGLKMEGLQELANKHAKERKKLEERMNEIKNRLSNSPNAKEIETYQKSFLKQNKKFDFDNLSLKKKRQLIKTFCQGRDEWFDRPPGIYVYQSNDVTELRIEGLLGTINGIVTDSDPGIGIVTDSDLDLEITPGSDPDILIVKKDEKSIDVKKLRLSLSMNYYKPYTLSNGRKDMQGSVFTNFHK